MREAVCPARVREAFARIEVPAALREKAEENLARWLEEEAFADARPQLESAPAICVMSEPSGAKV